MRHAIIRPHAQHVATDAPGDANLPPSEFADSLDFELYGRLAGIFISCNIKWADNTEKHANEFADSISLDAKTLLASPLFRRSWPLAHCLRLVSITTQTWLEQHMQLSTLCN